MSCLSKQHRINTQNSGSKRSLEKEFNKIYKSNKKWHTHSFVVFYQKSDNLHVAFVSSKKVGNAVARNRSKRVLRALMLQKEKQLVTGKYIFVAKSALLERDHKTLQKDFTYAIKKLELFV